MTQLQCKCLGVDQSEFAGQAFAQASEPLAGDFPGIGQEHQQVARLAAHQRLDLGKMLVVKVLADRAPQRPVVFDAEPGKSFGTEILFDIFGQFVDLPARVLGRRIFDGDAADKTAVRRRCRERRGTRSSWRPR